MHKIIHFWRTKSLPTFDRSPLWESFGNGLYHLKKKNYSNNWGYLLEIVRQMKLQRLGHVKREPGTLSHTILQSNVPGKRNQGRSRSNWASNVVVDPKRCHDISQNVPGQKAAEEYGASSKDAGADCFLSEVR